MGCNDDGCDIFPSGEDARRDYIYTITMLMRIDELIAKDGTKTGFPDFGDLRVVGYYFTYEDAINAVVHNECDIFETMYKYALIEKVEPGLYSGASAENRWLFKFNQDSYEYESVAIPEIMEHIYGLSIG